MSSVLAKDDFEEITCLPSAMHTPCFKIKRKADGKILQWKILTFSANQDEEYKNVEDELYILQQLKHENIVKFYGFAVEVDKNTNKVYIVTEYCDGGNMAELIQRVKEAKCYFSLGFVWTVFYQLILALDACRNMPGDRIVLHRNINPTNVFLTGNLNAKLGDFGSSRIMDLLSRAGSITGIPVYRAPELFRYESYNEKCDIWSLGCVLYEMCALEPPYSGQDTCDIARNVQKGAFPELDEYYRGDLGQTIRSMLTTEPLSRPSANMLRTKIVRTAFNKSSFSDGNGHFIRSDVVLPEKANLARSLRRKITETFVRIQ